MIKGIGIFSISHIIYIINSLLKLFDTLYSRTKSYQTLGIQRE